MKQLHRSVAVGLTVAALAAPAAHARPIIDRDVAPASPSSAQALTSPPPRVAAPAIVKTVDAGFDWSSAALGAGAASALILLASLGGFARTSRNRVQVAR